MSAADRGQEGGSDPETHVNLRELMADIEREVRDRRLSGELTPEFERQLDTAFARVAPVGAVEGDLSTLLDKIEASTTIDTFAPLPNRHQALREARKIIRRAIQADLSHLGVQVGGLTQALAHAVKSIAERLDVVEAAVADTDRAVLQLPPELTGRCELPSGPWASVCAEVLAHLKGRVLVAECGNGQLLGQLCDAGIDAYGVDPDETLVLDMGLRGLDARTARPEHHLRLLEDASLAGVVLSGCVDRRSPEGLVALLDLAVSRLAPEGSLVVISHDPRKWSTRRPVLAELSPGQPLSDFTWKALFEARSLRDIAQHPGAAEPEETRGYAVAARR